MKKPLFFEDVTFVDGREYISKDELERDYVVEKSTKVFVKVDGKLKYVPGSWKRFFKVRWEVLLLVFVVVVSFYMVKDYRDVYDDPCGFCLIDKDATCFPDLYNVSNGFVGAEPEFNDSIII